MKPDIKSLSKEELETRFKGWNQPVYRVRQVLEWLYQHRVTNWEAMSNLPRPLRQKLAGEFSLQSLELIRKQGAPDRTQKFLWRLEDHSLVESVLIPANPALYGEPSDRHTLCVSTQVGCAYGCKFCASGLEGWKRNLRPDEIVEQVLAIERLRASKPPGGGSKEGSEAQSDGEPEAKPDPRGSQPAPHLINNIVVMGMGEPLANYDHVLAALRILNAPWGGAIGARKITISTSGLVPQIRRLAEEPLQFRLAISLHGATDAVRDRIMPVNRKYPLKDLLAACEDYVKRKGRMLTLEYILIAGVNDGLEQAKSLARFAGRLNAKVNLIPYNPVDGLAWRRPEEPVQEAFLAVLQKLKIPATLRREKGGDIDAACGQLRLKTERELERLSAE